jgi:flagellin
VSLEVVCGINWGDEGKGRVVDYLARDVDLVVRFQGGNNAGHTVVNEFGTFKLHLIPSGIFNPRVVNVLGPGMVIDLQGLVEELADLERQGATASNIGNSVSFLQTQDGALKVAAKVLDRISELKTLYADPTKSASDLANYDSEFSELQTQLEDIAGETFNSVSLFGSSGLSVNVTESGSTSVAVQGRDLSSSASGVGAITAGGVTTLADIDLSDITTAIENVATFRAENGAEQSHLGFAAELLTINKANLEAAASRIMDVDVAEESTQLARWNILVQSGTAMLSQANQSAQSALRLIG